MLRERKGLILKRKKGESANKHRTKHCFTLSPFDSPTKTVFNFLIKATSKNLFYQDRGRPACTSLLAKNAYLCGRDDRNPVINNFLPEVFRSSLN
jgi:hypothetical protein